MIKFLKIIIGLIILYIAYSAAVFAWVLIHWVLGVLIFAAGLIAFFFIAYSSLAKRCPNCGSVMATTNTELHYEKSRPGTRRRDASDVSHTGTTRTYACTKCNYQTKETSGYIDE